jgi:hypothetical protein
MAIFQINTDPDLPFYTQRTVLDGITYILSFEWNEREERWYLSLADSAGVTIVSGIKVVANYPLNYLLTDPRAPGGILYALDISGTGQDPGLNDLGRRVTLMYIDRDSVNGALGD